MSNSKIFLIDDFLSNEEYKSVYKELEKIRCLFQKIEWDIDYNVRDQKYSNKDSEVLYLESHLEPVQSIIAEKLSKTSHFVNDIFKTNISWKSSLVTSTVQLHKKGLYFPPHKDSFFENIDCEMFLTAILFLCFDNLKFEGGKLSLWDINPDNVKDLESIEEHKGINVDPLNNRLVVFNMARLHHIEPFIVESKSSALSDFMCTIQLRIPVIS